MEETTSAGATFSLSSIRTADGNILNSYEENQSGLPNLENPAQLFPSNLPKRVLGRSRFICCSVLTRDGANSLFVAFILLFEVIIFLAGVVPRGEVYSYVVVSLFSLCALFSLLMSVAIDPGILLPLPPDPERRSQIIEINGREILCKVCPTCHIVRPPRSTHCQTCDYCVDEFDHHCGLLGSCVAKRTFRFFGGFFFFTSVVALYVGIRTIIVLVGFEYDMLGVSVERRWGLAAALVSLLVAVLASCMVLPLTWYYAFLACTNSTQKELGREKRSCCEPNRSFHKGYCLNFLLRCFGPLGKSRVTKEDADRYV